ncbi:MAG: prolipoprotein diacylglyceryl transferase [Planctomycetota bacterium]|jgi:phosphatidylglycerol:prolipoprotein diacylglycerol transferase|nr:prolipoprotein diacylglyceryl transferase [Planctomycetota bacterium]MDP6941570.1 prolipoprotein diacylglyceryl transferase [Planctomycetota bacterium]
MWPELLRVELFGAERVLSSFGLFVALGFMIGVWMATRLASKYGEDTTRDPLAVPDIAWWCLIGVIAGGRLAYVLVNLPYFMLNPVKIFAIWEGGLVMYGGLILAATLGAWKARKLGLRVSAALDWGLTGGFLGQAIGRIGCLMVGDDYGRPTDVPWALQVPDPLPQGSLFPEDMVGQLLHPTQPYMQLKAFSLFLLGLWLLKNKSFHGQVAAILVGGYAILRFVVEYFRGDSVARGGIFKDGLGPGEVPQHEVELLLSSSQMISLVVLPLALFAYWRLSKNRLAPPNS